LIVNSCFIIKLLISKETKQERGARRPWATVNQVWLSVEQPLDVLVLY
jgi:hypothetical protein